MTHGYWTWADVVDLHGDTAPDYDRRAVEDTLVVRVTESEFGA